MLDFSVPNKDTGLNNLESIEPINNGEDANQGTFRRPSENLRTRTEAIRKLLDHLVASSQADRSLCVMSPINTKLLFLSGKIRLNTSGTDTASDCDLIIAPIVSTYNADAIPGSAIRAKYYYADSIADPNKGKFQVVAKNTIYAYNGGNNLFIKIFKNGRTISPALPVVTIEGDDGGGSYPADGPVVIAVEIDKDDLHTIQNVVDAIVASVPAQAYIDTGLTMSIANATNVVEERTLRAFHEDTGGMAAVDAECYRISAAQIDNFFQPAGLNKTLAYGDTLVINFGTPEARRACRYDTNISSLLQIISEDSRALANGCVVPICKCGVDVLHFMNGKTFDDSVADYLVPSIQCARADDLRADLAKTTGTPYGDFMIGAAAKSAAAGVSWAVPLGTVNSQVQEVLNNLAANVTAAGAAKVGAKVVAGSPHGLTVGSVESQMGELLGFFNSHAAGVADKHHIGDITAKPFCSVDAGGGGDYDSLSDALEDLATTGGIILLRGTQTAVSCGTAITKPILVIGGDNALIQDSATGPTAAFTLSGAPQAPLTFRNVKFLASHTDMIIANVAPGGMGGWLVFEDCVFDRSSLSSTTTYVVRGRVPKSFRRCVFLGKSVSETAHAIAVTTDSVYSSAEVYECYFYHFKGVLITTDGHSVLTKIRASNNYIDDCGYSPASGADPAAMFEFDDVTHAWVLNNYVSGSAGQSGRFVLGGGYGGVISGNHVTYGCDEPGDVSTDLYMIDCKTSLTHCPHVIRDNYIHAGKIGGIRARRADISSNKIYLNSEHGDMSGVCVVSGSAANVSGNHIECNTLAINTRVILLGETTTAICRDVTCRGNRVTGTAGGSNVTGITIRNPQSVTVCDNDVSMSAHACGIRLSVDSSAPDNCYGTVISNNTLRNCAYGIEVGNTCLGRALKNTAITGNSIKLLGGAGAGKGISVSAVSGAGMSYTTIVGNNIELSTDATDGISIDGSTNGYGVIGSNMIYGVNSGDTGINMNTTPTNFAISGNAVFNCATQITQGSNTNGIGSGTPRDITHNAY